MCLRLGSLKEDQGQRSWGKCFTEGALSEETCKGVKGTGNRQAKIDLSWDLALVWSLGELWSMNYITHSALPSGKGLGLLQLMSFIRWLWATPKMWRCNPLDICGRSGSLGWGQFSREGCSCEWLAANTQSSCRWLHWSGNWDTEGCSFFLIDIWVFISEASDTMMGRRDSPEGS